MVYKLIATDEMESLLDACVAYLLKKFQSSQAASHLLDGVDKIYRYLEENPYIYRESQDPYMNVFHYREAKVPEMDYIVIYKIVENYVYILGIFHSLERYSEKMDSIWGSTWK
jgi:plasmid stabilization system protein ParE